MSLSLPPRSSLQNVLGFVDTVLVVVSVLVLLAVMFAEFFSDPW